MISLVQRNAHNQPEQDSMMHIHISINLMGISNAQTVLATEKVIFIPREQQGQM
jgi:hypothetical protein